MRVWSFKHKDGSNLIFKLFDREFDANFIYISNKDNDYLGLKLLCDNVDNIEQILQYKLESIDLYEYDVPKENISKIYYGCIIENPDPGCSYDHIDEMDINYLSNVGLINLVNRKYSCGTINVEFSHSVDDYCMMKCSFIRDGDNIEIVRELGKYGASISVDRVKFNVNKKEGSRICGHYGMSGFLLDTTFDECMNQAKDSTKIILLHYWERYFAIDKTLSEVLGRRFCYCLRNCINNEIDSICSEFRDKISSIVTFDKNEHYPIDDFRSIIKSSNQEILSKYSYEASESVPFKI